MAAICPACGVWQAPPPEVMSPTEKRIVPAALLCFFFGIFGVHRFYVGKVGTGVLQLFTLGGIGIWAMIDLIMILIGSFRDRDGVRITEWT
ncbi:MAG: TM2 domain-containing protein [Gemmatimonadota bacterium]|nr:TM2 domain-containing protein [Gemmatimonadota bacterium]